MSEHPADTAADCADAIVGALGSALQARGEASLALPGGRGGQALSAALAQTANLDWRRVTLTTSDERLVAMDDARSNLGALRAAASGAAFSKARFTALAALGGLDHDALPGDHATGYLGRSTPPLDVVVIGMGEDAHIASLFPNRPWAEALSDPRLFLDAGPPPPAQEARISLSPKALAEAGALILYAPGAEKRATLDRARAAPDVRARPAAFVLGPACSTQVFDGSAG